MGTCAIKGTGENKGFGQRKTLLSKKLLSKKIPDKVLRSPYPGVPSLSSSHLSPQQYMPEITLAIHNSHIKFSKFFPVC
jgi:hypothetical protein